MTWSQHRGYLLSRRLCLFSFGQVCQPQIALDLFEADDNLVRSGGRHSYFRSSHIRPTIAVTAARTAAAAKATQRLDCAAPGRGVTPATADNCPRVEPRFNRFKSPDSLRRFSAGRPTRCNKSWKRGLPRKPSMLGSM